MAGEERGGVVSEAGVERLQFPLCCVVSSQLEAPGCFVCGCGDGRQTCQQHESEEMEALHGIIRGR